MGTPLELRKIRIAERVEQHIRTAPEREAAALRKASLAR
jgi:hypothetical protein